MDDTAAADELYGLLRGIHRLVRRRLREEFGPPRLRTAEVELLRLVADEPGIGVGAAARELHLAGNSVSTLVNRLVQAGMLVRTPDPADRRAARLEVTEAARTRLADWRRRRGEIFTRLLGELPDEDQHALWEALPALRRLVDELSTTEHGGSA